MKIIFFQQLTNNTIKTIIKITIQKMNWIKIKKEEKVSFLFIKKLKLDMLIKFFSYFDFFWFLMKTIWWDDCMYFLERLDQKIVFLIDSLILVSIDLIWFDIWLDEIWFEFIKYNNWRINFSSHSLFILLLFRNNKRSISNPIIVPFFHQYPSFLVSFFNCWQTNEKLSNEILKVF